MLKYVIECLSLLDSERENPGNQRGGRVTSRHNYHILVHGNRRSNSVSDQMNELKQSWKI